ncbi:lipid-A-disaccharide kinase [Methylophilus rhizosphaerae]|uniref:Tetraacyldisaccharide 4'-kinase n=1 Tax=Methylophilus rhizosphaerae TaxID=492660 RepID=A0A1G9A2F6_9PROT|nr:tetraacyldisaccharide 4'-kinase [Methylophilus rhizosphaerae]SDK20570.1 lipid-A-disaccharide kinase [Methylophilus rhizosphaerae]
MWQQWFEQQWQSTGWAQILLVPVSWLFALLAGLRRWCYRRGILASTALPVPVIVIGNISIGGVGKTPLVIYLARQLRAAGYHPGILSRGYGGQKTGEVLPGSDPGEYGDEPVLIAGRSACPVYVHPLRVEGGRALLQAYPQTDVLICDDGLQHYALQRDVEIAVVQRPQGLGNGRLLPAGPLRETIRRLRQVDLVVETGQLPLTKVSRPTFQQSLQAGHWTAVPDFSTQTTLDALCQRPLLAIAGIGHPQRFFQLVQSMGLPCETQIFVDHHAYTAADFDEVIGKKTILMTEKDAVKCRHLGLTDAWFLPVEAVLAPVGHAQSLTDCVIRLLQQREGTSK